MSEFPTDWEKGCLGDIAKVVNGYAFLSDDFHDNHQDGIPVVRMSDIQDQGLNLENAKRVSNFNQEVLRKFQIRQGDLLFGMSGSIEKSVLVNSNQQALLNQRVGALRPIQDNGNFHAHIFQSESVKSQILDLASGGAQLNISAKQVESIQIDIPPLPEQKKIAEILSGIDISICLQKKKAEKYQIMITSIRDNLVKQLLLEESTKTLPLDNVSRVIDSLHSTPVFAETGVPMVRVTDIKAGALSLENTKKVTSEAYKLYAKNHEPAEGDIVISRVGSYGITSLNTRNQKFCIGQNTALIHPTSIDGCFLYECLNSSFLRDQVEFMVEGSGYKSLSLASIRSLRIPVPSAIDQCKLSSVLKSIQKSLAIEVEYGKKLAIAKNALSSDLLSGRKRVST